ncbi:MAG TPA: PEPxxWA-CTERM sorting domain-containing protein [Sphingomonas sp.]|nr:PEPxxWA-CTERM sorting domain-containing protein [Sphingomonas sp.]
MKKFVLAALASTIAASPAPAAINWADLTSSSTTGGVTTVQGNIGSTNVTFTGTGVGFVQTSGGTDFWNTAAYSAWDSTVNAPPNSDLIALSGAGTKTITFSSAVSNAYIALASWQNQSFSSTSAFSFVGLVNGCGYWGCGTPTAVTANSFSSPGELHGVIQFAGPLSSITFTDTNDEFWHGIQIGAGAVPEPAGWALMIGGFAFAGFAARRRRRPLAVTA